MCDEAKRLADALYQRSSLPPMEKVSADREPDPLIRFVIRTMSAYKEPLDPAVVNRIADNLRKLTQQQFLSREELLAITYWITDHKKFFSEATLATLLEAASVVYDGNKQEPKKARSVVRASANLTDAETAQETARRIIKRT